MTVKIEVDKIRDRLLRSGGGHFARPHETPEALHGFRHPLANRYAHGIG